MSIASENARVQYTLSGSGQTLAVPFYFLAAADLEVVKTSTAGADTTLVLTTDYTVSSIGNPAGGSITMVAGASGEVITIARAVALTQDTELAYLSQQPSATLERAYDRLVMQVQRLMLMAKRALRLPISAGELTPPGAAARAGKAWAFDASGNLELVNRNTFAETVVGDAEAARDAAEGFRDQAEEYKNEAELAKTGAETAEVNAETAEAGAEAALAAAEAALAAYNAGAPCERLRDLAAFTRSASSHRMAYEDAAVWAEDWADLADWAVATGQVSGGAFFANSTASPSGANRSFVVPAGGSARIVGTINNVAPVAVNLQMIGVSKAVAGAAPSSGSEILGIGIQGTGGARRYLNGGSLLLDAAPPTGVLVVVIDIDPTWVSLTMSNAAGTWQVATKVLRSDFGAINNVSVWNDDGRFLSGTSIGPVGARLSTATIFPRTGIEGIAASSISTRLGATDDTDARIYLPLGYDSRRPAPLVMVCHGRGNLADFLYSDALIRPTINALTAAGYIVAASTAYKNAWGNQNSIDANIDLFEYVCSRWAVSSCVWYGQSMGGLVALNTIATRRVPCAAFVGIYPVTNLENLYGLGSFASDIRTAFGFVDPNFETATDGYDPNDKLARDWLAVPMKFWASPSDTTVPKAQNTDLLAARVSAYSRDVSVVAATGVHGDPSHYDPAAVVAFFNKWTGASY